MKLKSFFLSNKRIAGLFYNSLMASIIAFSFQSDLLAIDYIYNGGNGNWSDATMWTPNGVPGVGDNVTITSNTLTLDIDATVNNLTLSGNLFGTNTLTVTGTMTWSSGTANASIVIPNTGTLNLSGNVNVGSLTLEGTTNHTAGSLFMNTADDVVHNSGIYNFSGGTININNGTAQFNNTGNFNLSFDGLGLGGLGPFNNDGTFTKTNGTGTTFIDCIFINNGTFNHDVGNILDFDRTFTQNGILNLNGSEELETELCTINAPFTLANGQLWDSNSWLTMNINYSTSAIVDVAHHLYGSGSLTINNTLNKSGQGNFNLLVTINTGAEFNHTYTGITDIRNILNLEGTTNHSNGSLRIITGNTINNSGTYNFTGGEIRTFSNTTLFNNTGTFNWAFDGINIYGFLGDFHNSGTFSKTAGAGTSTMALNFTNTGTISGNGNITFDKVFNQNNEISPGNSPGYLTLNKLNNNSGILNIEIKNNSGPQIGHDELNISGTNTLGGTLNVTLLDGFVPNLNDSYTIINCTSGCSGNFSTVNFPLDETCWDITYNANNVVISVINECNICPGDIDDDGVCGDVDNCPDISNNDQADNDGDGLGDVCDDDDDNDGCLDEEDANPLVASTDTDGDGDADDCDVCPNDFDNDIDGDGVCGDVDNCPDISNNDQADNDGDGLGDVCDDDDDNDGCLDEEDANPLVASTDTDGDGDADDCDVCPNDFDNDIDGDGVCGDVDNCPDISNNDQADNDGDGLGDVCDDDDDNDGCLDEEDANPLVASTDTDGDGDADDCDVCPNDFDNDIDGDGVCGDVDNCPDISNNDQADNDGDGLGDVCDDDDDNDGCLDEEDANPLVASTDTDGDGDADDCDVCPNDFDNDIDGDGVCGDVDNCPDISNNDQADNDGDGLGDVCDDDDDNDGCLDEEDANPLVASTDTDGDGDADDCDVCPNDFDNDIDGDGVCGDVDNCPDISNNDQADNDGDGLGDVCDIDECNSGEDDDCDGVANECDICPDGDDSIDNNEDLIPDCSQLLDYEDYSNDWKCANNKIYVCHNGKNKCINKNALLAHFNHGDYIGPCINCDETNNRISLDQGYLDIKIYPNPTIGEIEIIGIDYSKVKIIDAFGRIVKEQSVFNQKIDISDLPVGIYYISINTHNQQIIKRIIKL